MKQHSGHSSGLETTPPRGDAATLRRDAVENRGRILDAARQLFTESGIEAVSMHRIAQVAGVGQGTLYRHYPNKGDVCRDLISESTQQAMVEFDTYLRDNADQPALVRLDAVISRLLEYFDQKLPYLAAMDDACMGEYRTSKFKVAGYNWIHGVVAGLLTEAQAKGEIPPADPVFTADAILAALSPDMYQFQRSERGLTQEQIVQGVRRLYT